MCTDKIYILNLEPLDEYPVKFSSIDNKNGGYDSLIRAQ